MKERDYQPPIGEYTNPRKFKPQNLPTTYADINGLKRGLTVLINEINAFQAALESRMSRFALSVDSFDTKLVSSNENEWPEKLGSPKNYISYDFYKALQFRDTTSAHYIRTRYEEAARDITGNSALDFIHLTSIMKSEAILIQDFLITYIGNVNDSAEYRTIEQFQDWLLSAVGFTRQFTQFVQKGDTNPQFVLPAEIRNTSAQEAKQGQAFFRIKLNGRNDAIEKDLEFLQHNFSEYAKVFYSQHLGPALAVRLNITGPVLPVGGKINKIVYDSATHMNAGLNYALTDQMRRRVLFEEKVESIFNSIQERDTYKSYIQQLAVKGKALPSTGQRVMVSGSQQTVEEAEHFNSVQQQAKALGFTSAHAKLGGLDSDDHPQYLLKSGGVITGKILMEPGARIDGIIPSSHSHTGTDGSAQVDGRDILQGTLIPDAIDPSAKPPQPTSVAVAGITEAPSLSGNSTVDATIQWEGSESYTYEIQITRL